MHADQSHSQSGSTRRRFLGSSAVAAAGLAAARPSRAAAADTLALEGGKPAVSFPKDRHVEAARWPLFGPEEKKLVMEALELNSSTVYLELVLFENAWQEYYQVPHVKTHFNGTSALTSMFFALDLPPGSEIMVPTYTFFGAILPMRFFGLVPIFIDIDPKTACFDLQHAARELTPRTKALLPMHSWGNPCDMDQICDFAKEKGLIVLEDVAHAHGARLKGKLLGTWSEMSIFSFQATKPLPGIEGGMGMYQSREHYERAATFGHYKAPPTFPEDSPYRKYEGTGLGLKLRMHPLTAALCRRQVEILDQRNDMISAQVRRLNDRLTRLPGIGEPYCRPDAKRVYYDRNMLYFDPSAAGFSRGTAIKALQAEGVHANSGSYPCQHKYAVYSEAKWWHHAPKIPAVLPGSEQVNARALYLPLFTSEVPELVDQYIKAFEKVWAHRGQLAKA